MNNSEILLYQTEDGQSKIDVRLEDETVWLLQVQMAKLSKPTRNPIFAKQPSKSYLSDTATKKHCDKNERFELMGDKSRHIIFQI